METYDERELQMESGVFFCDACGDERPIEDAVERGAQDLICPVCAEQLEYDDEEGTLES